MYQPWATLLPRALLSPTSKVSNPLIRPASQLSTVVGDLTSGNKLCLNYVPFFCGVDVGEFVQADEVVARIETDKVTVDILS